MIFTRIKLASMVIMVLSFHGAMAAPLEPYREETNIPALGRKLDNFDRDTKTLNIKDDLDDLSRNMSEIIDENDHRHREIKFYLDQIKSCLDPAL